MAWDIPKDKSFSPEAVQCDTCGGWGCADCENRGWYADPNHPNGRRCCNCDKPIDPPCVAVYCSNECALEDA